MTAPAPPETKLDLSQYRTENGTVVNTKERINTSKAAVDKTQNQKLSIFCHVNNSPTDVEAPQVKIPTDEELWSTERPGCPNLQFLKEHFTVRKHCTMFTGKMDRDYFHTTFNILFIFSV